MTEFEKQIFDALTICRRKVVPDCDNCPYGDMPYQDCLDRLHEDIQLYLMAAIMDRDEEVL